MLPSIVLVTWAYKSLVLSFLSYNYWILFSSSGSGEKWWRDLNDFRCTSPFPGANSLEGGVIYKITKDKSYISSCTRWSFEEHYWNVSWDMELWKFFHCSGWRTWCLFPAPGVNKLNEVLTAIEWSRIKLYWSTQIAILFKTFTWPCYNSKVVLYFYIEKITT